MKFGITQNTTKVFFQKQRRGRVMDWPIIDFLFNIIVLSGLIGLLITIWMIILGIIHMLFEE